MFRYLFFVLLLSSAITNSLAQKQGSELIDSLKLKLKNSNEDTSKVRILGKLSFQYYRFDTDSGIIYAEQAIALAENLKWGLGLAFSYNYLGTNYAVKGDFPKALENFNKSLAKYTEIGDKQGIAFLCNNLGNFYRIQEKYDKAIDYINKAISINKGLNSQFDLIKNYNNLGSTYSSKSDFIKSNEYYYQALKIAKELHNKEHIALILVNISDNNAKLKNYCLAIKLGVEAIKLSEELGVPYDIAVYNSYVGDIYLKLSEDSVTLESKCEYFSNKKSENLNKAKKYLLKAVELLYTVKDMSLLSESSRSLSKVFEKLGDSKSALKYYKIYSDNKDSVFSNDNIAQIAKIEKKQEVELRDKQIRIQNLEIEKKNTQFIYQTILSVLLVMFALFISYFYYKKKANKTLRKSEERFRSLFEDAQVGLYRSTPNGKLLMANRALLKILGYPSFEIFLSKSLTQIALDGQRDKFNQLIEKNGEVKNLEGKWTSFNGNVIIVREYAKVIYDSKENLLFYDGTVEDITERREAEILLKEKSEEIKIQNQEYIKLNEQLQHINQDLQSAKEEAEESNQLKTSFLQNISHEIRTPLNAINGFSSMLNKPYLSEEKRKLFTSIIKNNSDQLLLIVSDVLTISSLEKNQEKLDIQKVNLNNILNDLLTKFKEQAFEKNILIEAKLKLADEQSEIFTDGEKLIQILNNLLTNAFKFTYIGFIEFGYQIIEGQSIDSLPEMNEKISMLQFYVKDTGIGIAAEQHEKIFERFRQVEIEITKKTGGTGLGLSISKGLVDLLGGKIWVESEPGMGATFFFTIPYNPVREFNTEIKAQRESKKEIIILVAEDEEYNFQLIEELLIVEDYRLIHAVNGKEAVEACYSNPAICLVLMDIKMPVMDGHEAALKIKKIRPDLPIIAQSAYSLEYENEKFSRFAFDDFISKPIDEDELKQKVLKYFGLQKK